MGTVAAPALVTVATFDTVAEAAVVQALLESDGIRVHAGSADLIRLDWSFSQSLGGVRLQVPRERAEDAIALIAAYRRGDTALVDDDAVDPDACARCGSTDVEARSPGASKLLLVALWLFPGALFPTRQSLRTCRACGHRWSIDP